MNHGPILPLVLPLIAGMVNLLLTDRVIERQRTVSLACVAGLLAGAIGLLASAATGEIAVYRLGDWPAPFGIVLVVDRLSALLLVTTALLALPVLLHACGGDDRRGRNFHVFAPLLLLGVNGAFLTGDLFNLFVFFEILLIASYCLALHGGGAERVRAGLHYVVLNLIGSALFLVGVGVLYGLAGTLNMADLAVRGAALSGTAGLFTAASLLLLVVFGLKAALLPLHLWLPALYGSVTAPVAALFAIMTKVGVYAILRASLLIFHPSPAAGWTDGLLPPLALATLLVAGIGVLGAPRLRLLVAYLVVLSVGMLLAGIGQFTVASIGAALYYLPHSTWVAGGLFLLADLIAAERGQHDDHLVRGPVPAQPLLLGGLFFFGAVAVAGLPPLAGFVGKLLLLRAVPIPGGVWLWGTVLLTSLMTLVALSRAGSRLFWGTTGETLARAEESGWRLVPAALLLALSVALSMGAAPASHYAEAAAAQLLSPGGYIEAVLGGGEKP